MESHTGPNGAAAEMAPGDATAALSMIHASRDWLADRIIAPGWYHVAFGLLAGSAIAEAELRSWVLFAWSVVAYTAGCATLLWWNHRRVGVAINYFDTRTRAVYYGHVLTLSGLIAIASWLELSRGTHGAFVAAGVLAIPLTVVFGRWTDRLLRARLQASR
jgi:hypothetical protein